MLHEAFGDRIPDLIKELLAVRAITIDELAEALRDRRPDVFERHDRQDAASPPAVVAEFIAEDAASLSITVSTEVEQVPMPNHDGNPRVEQASNNPRAFIYDTGAAAGEGAGLGKAPAGSVGDELGPDDEAAKNASSSGNSDCNPGRVGEGRTKPPAPSDGASAADDVTVHTGASAIESGDGSAEPTAKDWAEMNALFGVNEAVETAGVIVPCNDEADPDAAGHDGMPPSNETPFNSAASDGAGRLDKERPAAPETSPAAPASIEARDALAQPSAPAPEPEPRASVPALVDLHDSRGAQRAFPRADAVSDPLEKAYLAMPAGEQDRDRHWVMHRLAKGEVPTQPSEFLSLYMAAAPDDQKAFRARRAQEPVPKAA
jgi:hypothetical protein